MGHDCLAALEQRARRAPCRVVLPEATDPTILHAARRAYDLRVAWPILLGNSALTREIAAREGIDLTGLALLDVDDPQLMARLANECVRGHPGASLSGAFDRVRDPLVAAALLVAAGGADALVAGEQHPTADVLHVSLTYLGLGPGVSTASSMFLMQIPGFAGSEGEYLAFADAGMVVSPEPEQLADIAISTAGTMRSLLGWEPRVAMLSYSTKGSAEHNPSVDRIVEAVKLVRQREPDLAVDGELQLDAAVDPEVAARKLADVGPVAGRANILIFPDLEAGNIAYKCVERFARARAYGPFLQGFAHTVSDLSRGSTVDDVVGTLTMASVQAQRED